MKAIAIKEYGSAEKLHLVELSDPQPKEGEVLIRLKGAGVGLWDVMNVQGEFQSKKDRFPLVPGWEGSGIVEALGPNVTNFRPGDEVYYYDYPEEENREGAWAEKVCIPADKLAKKPERLSLEEAGGLPIIALTAYQSLFEGIKIKRGQSLLITNGAGGVGTCAIQFAHDMGVEVIALSSERNFGLLKELGADHVFDYHKDFTEEVRKKFPNGVDCIFDTVGDRGTVSKAVPTLRQNGVFLTIVDLFEDLLPEGVRRSLFYARPDGKQLEEISRWVDDGRLRLKVDQIFRLEEAREALRKVDAHHVHGKVVLKIAS